MTELSNAVTVLIARMESHPEDFNVYNGELYNKTKFGDVAGALYGLVGMDAGKAGAYWFLSDADKEALIEAWKKYHRVAMEKEVMEKIFDDGEGARELEKVEQQLKQAQIRAQLQGSMLQATRPGQSSYPYMANSAQNAAQNSGLLGQAGSALQGLFK